jgi:hypothetical protein
MSTYIAPSQRKQHANPFFSKPSQPAHTLELKDADFPSLSEKLTSRPSTCDYYGPSPSNNQVVGDENKPIWWERAPPGWTLLTPTKLAKGTGKPGVYIDYGGDSEYTPAIERMERRVFDDQVTRRHRERRKENELLLQDVGDLTPLSVIMFQQRVESEPGVHYESESDEEEWQPTD